MMKWIVDQNFGSRDDVSATDRSVQLAFTHLEGQSGSFFVDQNGWSVRLVVVAEGCLDAVRIAVIRVDALLSEFNAPEAFLIEVSASPVDLAVEQTNGKPR